ncbi:hypothetical protein [Salinibaculum salinum]|uniref:hypothetical protein n=1 Tax=Salinibaculum salinum TaxID=3131996 RepID=UPI0030EF5284
MSIQTEARFPPITGETLTGRTLTFPGDFEAPLNLVFVAFKRSQQSDVDTWLDVAVAVESDFPDVRFYEIPVISRLYAPARSFIDGGMRVGIPDDDTRERTVTVYTDKRVVRRALDIDDEGDIHALLVDRDGTVYWRAAGPKDNEAAEHLREVLSSLT